MGMDRAHTGTILGMHGLFAPLECQVPLALGSCPTSGPRGIQAVRKYLMDKKVNSFESPRTLPLSSARASVITSRHEGVVAAAN